MWTDDRQRIAADIRFWPTEFSRIRAQGSADIPTWHTDAIYAAFLALEFSIGTHGTHTF